MRLQGVRWSADGFSIDSLERSDRENTIPFDLHIQGAVRHRDTRDVDAIEYAGALVQLLIDDGKPVHGARLPPDDTPNLLQTVHAGLVQTDLPACPSLGADLAHIHMLPCRCEGAQKAPASAALFCADRIHAPGQGCDLFASATDDVPPSSGADRPSAVGLDPPSPADAPARHFDMRLVH